MHADVQTLTILKPDDMHVHVRQNEMLWRILCYTGQVFGRAIIMPNTLPAILTAADAKAYYDEIQKWNKWDFRPLMTIKITPDSTPKIIEQAAKSGLVFAGKLYPEGVTTNSEDGVTDFHALWPVFAAMQEVDMVLCIHGELPKAYITDQEAEFLSVLEEIRSAFPELRIVMEHISTAAAANLILS